MTRLPEERGRSVTTATSQETERVPLDEKATAQASKRERVEKEVRGRVEGDVERGTTGMWRAYGWM